MTKDEAYKEIVKDIIEFLESGRILTEGPRRYVTTADYDRLKTGASRLAVVLRKRHAID